MSFVENILTRYGTDGKFFFITKDPPLEIVTIGGGYDDVPIHHIGSLFHYANQWLEKEDIPDKFGRNHLDRSFIALCSRLHLYLMFKQPNITFKSLTTRKEGEKYLVRVQYDDEDLELEVEEMFNYFSKKLEEV